MHRRSFVLGLAGTCFALPVLSAPYFLRQNLAANGHDVVAYFTQGQPVPGLGQFVAEYDGARFAFESAANRAAFAANPAQYAPHYGGWCAFAMAHNAQASTVPQAWSVVGNRLYLNFSLDVRESWRADPAGFIARADANWPNFAR
ncbi:MAG: YHS domain-containing (seleno)protein [Paracoccaceae bacterium]